ncbi:beta-lactamase-like protein [Amylocarpus encephaloides]|uniref:Beta-lactamase-like protein n=1 Tax=Amylocarpus encephaloides TaxID=45428 RepID=A0A9P7YG76_9HELO|nr:beta-lactamase-like protein [Amylocarpus encephaloides]
MSTTTPPSTNHPRPGKRSSDHGIWEPRDAPPAGYTMSSTSNLLVCFTCGTQFDVEEASVLKTCRICDDPRQFVPPTGQSFTTLSELKASNRYHNEWKAIDGDDRFWSIRTEPQMAIGQRAILVKTEAGNVLWDCITYLDQDTADWINSLGGLAAIVISHPHYYSTHLEWAEEFNCPVYLSWEDKEWLNRHDRLGKARCFIEGPSVELELNGEMSGITAIKLGGHFPGSLVLLAFGRLMIADTIVTTPSGKGDWSSGPAGPQAERPEGLNSYSFLWSIPNMIPLSAEEVEGMWNLLKKYGFSSTHGAFPGMDIHDGFGGSKKGVKQRILDSMQIQVRRMGWQDHTFLKEVVK